MRKLRSMLHALGWALLIGGLVHLVIPERKALAAGEYFVYSIYRALDLGNPLDPPQKDYYINMGSKDGVQPGVVLEVVRKVATYDLSNQKLYRDMTFPIARLKVIHTESNAAIARLERLLPPEKTPATSPRAVMIGDLVRLAE